jgi:hypothetical protein
VTNRWLVVGGCLSAAAALLHLGIIFGGPAWYRFFGAGEGMARMAERGLAYPTIVTVGIAVILFTWAAYAFSGAGLIPRLPFLRLGLVVIASIYLLRGLAVLPTLLIRPDLIGPFAWWSSGIVLAFGLVYAAGIWRGWASL